MEKTGLWLTDWGLTALLGQIGYIFAKYVAVKKVKLMRKLTMLRVWNTYNIGHS